MAQIKRFSGFNESTLPEEILKRDIKNLNFGTKEDFDITPLEDRKSVYDEDYFLSRNCRIMSNKNNKGKVEVKIELFTRGEDGYASFILMSALGVGSDYNSAYLNAVESFIFQMPSI